MNAEPVSGHASADFASSRMLPFFSGNRTFVLTPVQVHLGWQGGPTVRGTLSGQALAQARTMQLRSEPTMIHSVTFPITAATL